MKGNLDSLAKTNFQTLLMGIILFFIYFFTANVSQVLFSGKEFSSTPLWLYFCFGIIQFFFVPKKTYGSTFYALFLSYLIILFLSLSYYKSNFIVSPLLSYLALVFVVLSLRRFYSLQIVLFLLVVNCLALIICYLLQRIGYDINPHMTRLAIACALDCLGLVISIIIYLIFENAGWKHILLALFFGPVGLLTFFKEKATQKKAFRQKMPSLFYFSLVASQMLTLIFCGYFQVNGVYDHPEGFSEIAQSVGLINGLWISLVCVWALYMVCSLFSRINYTFKLKNILVVCTLTLLSVLLINFYLTFFLLASTRNSERVLK